MQPAVEFSGHWKYHSCRKDDEVLVTFCKETRSWTQVLPGDLLWTHHLFISAALLVVLISKIVDLLKKVTCGNVYIYVQPGSYDKRHDGLDTHYCMTPGWSEIDYSQQEINDCGIACQPTPHLNLSDDVDICLLTIGLEVNSRMTNPGHQWTVA